MNTDGSVKYKLGRGIDYLGSITRMLRDLSGFATLVYELLQNADDTPGATTVRFEITPASLIIWNNGQFSDCGHQELHPDQCPWLTDGRERCDFHRFRSVSAGDKGRRADLTGAFGIGFTAVYQITDQPEIISSGQHWIIDETQPEAERIDVHTRCAICDGETGTRLILPWAFNPKSDFRQRTNAPAVDPTGPAELADVLDRVVPTAMLFLRRIRRVELLRNSESRVTVVREDDENDVLISNGQDVRIWRVISGDFSAEAEELRIRYPSKLEKASDVAVAVAHGIPQDGLLCAYLPTEERTGLPFHVNADFFVASDRKRLVVEGYQGEWNRAAIEKAAELLAEHLLEVREVCQARQLWSLLVDAHQATSPTARARELRLDAFWDRLEPNLRTAPILLTTEHEWRSPQASSIVLTKEEEPAAQLLASLGGVFADPELREFCFRLPYERSLGLTQFRIEGMVDILVRNGLDRRVEIRTLPVQLRSDAARETLIRELEILLARAPEESKRRREAIGRLALAPGWDGAVWPWTDTFRADQRTRTLFTPFAQDSEFLDERQLPQDVLHVAALVPVFDAPVAISWLGDHEPDSIGEILAAGEVSTAELLEWFEAHKSEFIEDHDLVADLADVALFPSSTGFKPLSELALPGDFVDELGLADIVDVERVGNSIPLLKRLGAVPLTFVTYVAEFVPKAANLSISDPDRWWKLVLLMAEKLSQIEDAPELRAVLEELPCIRIVGGNFQKPSEVYFASEAVTKILGEFPAALLPSRHHRSVEAFYSWVGVATSPRPPDVLERVRLLAAVPPTQSAIAVMTSVVEYLAIGLAAKPQREWGGLGALTTLRWLPARDEISRWYGPREIYTTFQDYLFQSQARFLGIPLPIQRNAASFLEELGVGTVPSTPQIVSHLIHCSDSGAMVNPEIYAVLNQRVNDPHIDRLKGKPSILLSLGKWVLPSFVFWGEHPFGRFRAVLSTDFRRYDPLLSRIGVREQPTYEDASAVLLEMESEFGPTHTPIEVEDDIRVYSACWRILDEALTKDAVPISWFDQFKSMTVVRDARGILNAPDRIFFADVPGLAERFPKELGNHLIRRPEGAWRAMRAAGVRDLSRAVTTRMLELGERESDVDLRSLFIERTRQIGRVVDPFDSTWPNHIPTTIGSLNVVSTTQLTVEYSLGYFEMTAPAADLDALYVPDLSTLYVCRTEERRWLGIARELARAIASDTPPGSLAANLAMVLSAPTGEAADHLLDEAGVPRLEAAAEGAAATELVGTFAGVVGPPIDVVDEGVPQGHVDVREPEHGSSEQEPAGAVVDVVPPDTKVKTGTSSPGPGGQDQGRGDGPRSRLRSYVVPAGASADDGLDVDAKKEADSAVDRAGVDRVLSFERASGRTPEEKPHEFPGYDVVSMGPNGTVDRFIEVKSTAGEWDGYGVSVSPRQMSESRQLGEMYWLYVVARAEQPDFTIYCIQDPASKVDQFLFDDGWASVGETSIAGRPIRPPHLVDAAVRLSNRDYIPFFESQSQELGVSGAEAGWFEWNGDAAPGSFLIKVLGDALAPWASEGSLVLVEPMNSASPEADEPVLLVLTGQSDPETGRDLAFRIWPAEEPNDDGAFALNAVNPATPPLLTNKQSVRILGRLMAVPTISGWLG